MKTLRLAAALAFLIPTACATIHGSHVGKTVGGEEIPGLVVSAKQTNDSNKEPFINLTVSFENKSDEWIRITNIEVPIGESDSAKVSVVVGNDLIDWAKAKNARAVLDQHNQSMAQLGLAAAGAVVAGASAANGDQTGTAAGVGMVAGAQGWATGAAIDRSYNKAAMAKWVPDDHVYSPFSIPGQAFVRKWILFNIKKGISISEIPVVITTADGKKSTVNMKVTRDPL